MKDTFNQIFKTQSKVIVFTGAGISYDYPTFLPLGNELILQFFNAIGCKNIINDINNQKTYLRPEVIMQILHEKYDDNLLKSLSYFKEAKPNRIHYFLDNLIYNNKASAIITTNLDLCHEKAKSSNYTIEHLHGRVDDYETILYALNQVGNKNNTENLFFLKKLLCKDTVTVFIGYSGLDDFDIGPILSQCDSHFVWVQHTNNQTEILNKKEEILNESAFDILKNKKEWTYIKSNSWEFCKQLSDFFHLQNDFKRIEEKYIVLNDERFNMLQQSEIKLKQFFSDSSNIDSLLIESELYWRYMNNPDKAIIGLDKIIEQKTNSKQQAELLRNYGYSYYRKGMFRDAKKKFIELLENNNLSGSLSKATLLKNIGNIEYWENDFPESRKYYKKALKEAKSDKEYGMIYHDYALLEQDDYNRDEAINLYDKAEKYYKHTGDVYSLSDLYNNKGIMLFEIADYKNAKKNYLESLSIRKQINHLQGLIFSYLNLGLLYREMYVDSYKKKFLIEAKSNFNKSLDYAIENKGIDYALVLKNIGDFQIDNMQLEEAMETLNSAYKIYHELNHFPSMFSVLISILEINVLLKSKEETKNTIVALNGISDKYKNKSKKSWLNVVLDLLNKKNIDETGMSKLQIHRINLIRKFTT